MDTEENKLSILITEAAFRRGILYFSIHVETSLSEYEVTNADIIRRQQDFKDLLNYAKNNYGEKFFMLPHYPEESLFSVEHKYNKKTNALCYFNDTNDISEGEEERVLEICFRQAIFGHELLLKRLADIPQILFDAYFIEFLTSPYPMDLTITNSSVGMLANLKNSPDRALLKLIKNKKIDSIIIDEAFNVIYYISNIKSLLGSINRHCTDQRKMGEYLCRIADTFLNISHTEQYLFSIFLKNTSKWFTCVMRFQNTISDDELIRFYGAFEDDYEEMNVYRSFIAKMVSEIIRRNSSNPFRVKNSYNTLESNGKDLDALQDCLCYQQDKFKSKRTYNLKTQFVKYCQRQITYYKNHLEDISNVIDQLEKNMDIFYSCD